MNLIPTERVACSCGLQFKNKMEWKEHMRKQVLDPASSGLWNEKPHRRVPFVLDSGSKNIMDTIKSSDAAAPDPYAPPDVREKKLPAIEETLQELSHLALQVRKERDSDVRRVAELLYYMRFGLLSEVCEGLGIEPKKAHDWAENLLKKEDE